MLSIGGAVAQNSLNTWQQNVASVCGLLGPIAVPKDSVSVAIVGMMYGNPGAGTTGITLAIYRGASAAGVLLELITLPGVVAGATLGWTMMAVDSLLTQATVQYALVATGTGMSGAGAFNTCTLAAIFMQ